MHGQIQRRGRFAAAADADQDHVAFRQVGMGLAIVVCQAEIDGFDPVFVFLAFGRIGKASDAVVALDTEFHFQRLHERAEHVEHHGAAFGLDQPENVVVDQGAEDDRALAFGIGGVIDLLHGQPGFFHVGYKWQPDMAQGLLELELIENGAAKRLGGDAGAVRDKKNGALVLLWESHGAFFFRQR